MLLSGRYLVNKLVGGFVGTIGTVVTLEGYKAIKKKCNASKQEKEMSKREFKMYDLREEPV